MVVQVMWHGLMWHDRIGYVADRWMNQVVTCVIYWENVMVPCGLVVGYHMAPLQFGWHVTKFL
jgi:hypothetical protein